MSDFESDFEFDAVEVSNEGIFDLWDVTSVSESESSDDTMSNLIPVEVVSDDENRETDENEDRNSDNSDVNSNDCDDDNGEDNGDSVNESDDHTNTPTDDEVDDESDNVRGYTITNSSRRFFPKFNLMGQQLSITFDDARDNDSLIGWMRRCFTKLLKNLITDPMERGNINPSDRVAIILTSSDGFEDIHVSFRRPDQITVDVVLDRIMIVSNSNKEFLLNQNLVVKFHHVRMPIGRGAKVNLRGASIEEFAKRKYGIISYKIPSKYEAEEDTSCLAYSIVLAIAHANKDTKKLRSLKRYFDKLRKEARDLCNKAGVNLTANRGGGLDELLKFQKYLRSTYKICVYSDRYGNSVLFEEVTDSHLKTLNLILDDEHFYAVTSCTAAFACSYYCEQCHKGYNQRYKHKCPYTCSLCFNETKCNDIPYEYRLHCGDCNRRFNGKKCFDNHKVNICDRFKVCIHCDRFYDKKSARPHMCEFYFCKICEDMKRFEHDCYMPGYVSKRDYDEVSHSDDDEVSHRDDDDDDDDEDDSPKRKKKNKKDPLFIFYDFETTQNMNIPDSETDYEHIPNLCVANNVCKWCIDIDKDINIACHKCGDRVHVFEGETCVESFMQYVVRREEFKKYKNVIIVAHNMGMFDGHFLLKHIYDHGGYGTPKIIMNGTKIVLMSLGNKYKFLDSLNYFGVGLAKLPGMFNFPEEKGYYPHLWNTTDHYTYEGEIPPIRYYCPDTMDSSDRKKLLKWHKSQKESKVVFNNRIELQKYCKRDVEILRKACSEFRRSFWSENKIDPFIDASTIAGACNKVFRANYLQPETIGIIPNGGYRFNDNQSQIALKWLCWVEVDKEIILEHAGRTKEVRLPGIGAIDGYHPPSNTVYEFQGCYWHACTDCYPVQNTRGLDGTDDNKMFLRRERTERKLEKIRKAGYNLIVKRECDFKRELVQCPEIDILLWGNPYIVQDPLKPRDGFYGGRTNAIKLYYKVLKGEKIKYLDICSLYPHINKNYKSVVGHPKKIHVGPDECAKVDFSTVEGMVKCTVLAPRKLRFPILPSNMHHRLMFYLCRTCAMKQIRRKCTHGVDDRSFHGTWTADELREALKNGYQIVKLYEIWEYDVVRYNQATKSGGLFSGYINNFIRLKAEASGFPDGCVTDEQKKEYVHEFEQREGVSLDIHKICKNPGLRALAKIMCNSFWGKFGQLENRSTTVVIDRPQQFYDLLTNTDITVESFLPINDNVCAVTYSTTEEAHKPLNHVNVVLAAYTTAGARLELYKYLEMLGDRVLYFDTDSIIFIEREGDISPPTGPFLGDLTDELAKYGPGSYITEFVSGGPKNYAFKVYSPTKNETFVVCKVKGISLNHKNSSLVNFDSIKDMILNENDKKIVIEDCKILRTTSNVVYSTKRKKTYQMCYTKRMRLADGMSTCAWGY